MKLSFDKLMQIFPDGKIDRRGKNLITNCPECGEREFSISLDENHLCGCFRKKQCGWSGNVFTLMIKIGRGDVLVNRDINYSRVEKVLLYREEEKLDLNLPDFSPPIGWKRVYDNGYLNSRLFNEYERYKVGMTSIDPRLSNFVVFLIEEENKVKAWIGRSPKTKKEIEVLQAYYKSKGIDKKVYRYLNSLSDFGKLVLGIDELTENTKTIILVEGIFDKFRIDRLLGLHNQEEVKCLCTFKCAVSKEQIYKIQQKAPNIETTILLYDPDVIEDIKKASFELRDYMGRVLIGFSESGRDPGDFIDEDLEVFDKLRSPTDFAVSKISSKKLKI